MSAFETLAPSPNRPSLSRAALLALAEGADALPPPEVQTFAAADGLRLAYRLSSATDSQAPMVVFLHGLMSDMDGGKALFLEQVCRRCGLAFLRFDQQGHGMSDGDFVDGTIGRWADDTLAVLDQLTGKRRVILVGSSMGGWLMLLAARARPDLVAGLVGIAPAPDFSERLTWASLSAAQKAEVEATGRVLIPSDYAQTPYVFTKAFFDDGRRHLLLDADLPFSGPVRLLHGQQDTAVPWQQSLTLMQVLTSKNVRLHLIKDGDHRLSRADDLITLAQAVEEVLAALS